MAGVVEKNILPVVYDCRRRELGASRREAYEGVKHSGLCNHNFRTLSIWRQKYSLDP